MPPSLRDLYSELEEIHDMLIIEYQNMECFRLETRSGLDMDDEEVEKRLREYEDRITELQRDRDEILQHIRDMEEQDSEDDV